jgi:diacylglycerol kinase
VTTSTQSDAKVIPISNRTASPQRFKTKNFAQSVGFAVSGLRNAIETERNLRTQLVIAALATVAGVLLRVSLMEWSLLVLCMGVMMAVETLNTAIEYTVDLMTGGIYHEKAKAAKDAAAGACLLTAITVAGVGACIFVPHLWQLLQRVL